MRWKRWCLITLQLGGSISLIIFLAFFLKSIIDSSTRDILPGWQIFQDPGNINTLTIQGSSLWAGGKKGLYNIDLQSSVITEVQVPYISSKLLKDLVVSQNSMWAVFDRQLVKRDSLGAWTAYPEIQEILPGSFNVAMIDHNGTIWIGGEQGVALYDGKTFKRLQIPEKFKYRSVDVLFEDKNNRIWIGSSDSMSKGLLCFENHIFTSYSTRDGLLHNAITSVIQDKQGIIRAGMGFAAAGGTAFFSNNKWHNDSLNDPQMDAKIRTVFEDKAGRLLFGFEYDGLALRTPQKNKYFSTSDGLAGNEVKDIVQDINGNYWIATDKGITRIDSGQL